jgi:uncharacterized protein YegL
MTTQMYNDCWNMLAIDKSGSMRGKQADVIGGYSTLLEEQQDNKLSGKNRWTAICFNDKVYDIYDCDICDAEDLTIEQIMPRGSTAILDTLGHCYNKISKEKENYDYINIHIITDGQENSSRVFNHKSLNFLKESVLKTHKINLFFIGADESCLDGIEQLGPVSIQNCHNDFPTAFRQVARNVSRSQSREHYNGSGGYSVNRAHSEPSAPISEPQRVIPFNAMPPPLRRH